MNAIDKETYKDADERTLKALQWEMFNSLFMKMDTFVTHDDIKWWKRLLVAFSLGAGAMTLKESLMYFKLLGL